MPEWMPKRRASYDAVATTARCVGSPAPPTTTGLPRSSGCRATSTAARNSSRSTCSTQRDSTVAGSAVPALQHDHRDDAAGLGLVVGEPRHDRGDAVEQVLALVALGLP